MILKIKRKNFKTNDRVVRVLNEFFDIVIHYPIDGYLLRNSNKLPWFVCEEQRGKSGRATPSIKIKKEKNCFGCCMIFDENSPSHDSIFDMWMKRVGGVDGVLVGYEIMVILAVDDSQHATDCAVVSIWL